MKKVRIFQSIHLKFVLIYVLLILVAMQVIGVYFVARLETKLVNNFKESLTEKVNLLAYNVEELLNEREDNSSQVDEEIKTVLSDFATGDIIEVRVIDGVSKIVATSDPDNQGIIGKRTTIPIVKKTLVLGADNSQVYVKEDSKKGFGYMPNQWIQMVK